MLRRALDEVLPYAQQNGVRLALDPTHPMYRADTSLLMTLAVLDAVETAGWDGLYDVEVFSDTADYPRVLSHCREWFDRVWRE